MDWIWPLVEQKSQNLIKNWPNYKGQIFVFFQILTIRTIKLKIKKNKISFSCGCRHHQHTQPQLNQTQTSSSSRSIDTTTASTLATNQLPPKNHHHSIAFSHRPRPPSRASAQIHHRSPVLAIAQNTTILSPKHCPFSLLFPCLLA